MATGRQEASEDETVEFLVLQTLAEAEEEANLMRMLVRRTDKRLYELIWHLDIEPLERESAERRAHLLSLLGQTQRPERTSR